MLFAKMRFRVFYCCPGYQKSICIQSGCDRNQIWAGSLNKAFDWFAVSVFTLSVWGFKHISLHHCYLQAHVSLKGSKGITGHSFANLYCSPHCRSPGEFMTLTEDSFHPSVYLYLFPLRILTLKHHGCVTRAFSSPS